MRRRLVVIGEAMLDIDVAGAANRLTPEAPVPVVDVAATLYRPGGAALAALLAAKSGAQVTLATPLGADAAAAHLRRLLASENIAVIALPQHGDTPTKRRIRANGQTVARLDEGGGAAPCLKPPDALVAAVTEAAAVLVSDYGRGLTGDPVLRKLLRAAAARIPVVWDPHPRGADPIPGTMLVTPNDAEAEAFAARSAVPAGEDSRHPGQTAIARDARNAAALVAQFASGAVAVTSAAGALLSYGGGAPQFITVPAKYDGDTCGAGDQFAAAAAVALARGDVLSNAVSGAVQAAASYVATGGAAALATRQTGAPTRSNRQAAANGATGQAGAAPAAEIAGPNTGAPVVNPLVAAQRCRDRGGIVVATGGCFDILHAGHVASLQAARQLGDCLIVCLNSDASVRRLKGAPRPIVPQEDRAKVLLSLACVDAVAIFEEDTPEVVLRSLRPEIWAKGGDYAGRDLPEQRALAEWGGQAVALPYLDGRSTTRLLATAAQRPTEANWRAEK